MLLVGLSSRIGLERYSESSGGGGGGGGGGATSSAGAVLSTEPGGLLGGSHRALSLMSDLWSGFLGCGSGGGDDSSFRFDIFPTLVYFFDDGIPGCQFCFGVEFTIERQLA